MKIVLEWLLTLRTQFMPNAVGYSFSDTLGSPFGSDASPKWKQLGDRSVNGDSVQKDESSRGNSSFQRALRSPVMAGIFSGSSLIPVLYHLTQTVISITKLLSESFWPYISME